MKLFELYLLSFVEQFDTIEAMDPEKADIIQKVNQYLDLKTELTEKGISAKMIGQMKKLKSGVMNCEDVSQAINRLKAGI